MDAGRRAAGSGASALERPPALALADRAAWRREPPSQSGSALRHGVSCRVLASFHPEGALCFITGLSSSIRIVPVTFLL